MKRDIIKKITTYSSIEFRDLGVLKVTRIRIRLCLERMLGMGSCVGFKIITFDITGRG